MGIYNMTCSYQLATLSRSKNDLLVIQFLMSVHLTFLAKKFPQIIVTIIISAVVVDVNDVSALMPSVL